jgi:hypothetical protein
MRYALFISAMIATLLLSVTVVDAAVIGKPANQLGLVGYWSFNEGSGTSAGDSSGKHNTGAIFNSPAWVPGMRGKALSFDGSTQYVDVGTSTAINFTGAITLSAWVKFSDLNCSSGCDVISNYSSDGLTAQYEMSMLNGEIAYSTATGGWPSVSTTNTPITQTGKWYHIVITRDNTGVRTADNVNIYINGQLQPNNQLSGGSTGTPPSSGFGKTAIGRDGDFVDPALYFPGVIDEVRIYNRDLSAAEVSALYKAGGVAAGSAANLGAALTQGLVGYWTMDRADSNNPLYDRSGNGNHAYFSWLDNRLTNATSSSMGIGKIGQALKFPRTGYATSTLVYVLPAASINNLSRSTIGAWIYLDSDSAGYQSIYAKATNGSQPADAPSFLVNRAGNVNRLEFGYENSDFSDVGFISSNNAVPIGEWVHVMVAFDRSNAAADPVFYINGVATSSIQTGAPDGTTRDDSSWPPLIGAYGNGAAEYMSAFFKGRIDEVRVYNREITAAEAKQIYNLGAQKINSNSNTLTSGGLNSDLVGHWTLDGTDVTDKVYDKSGSANHGYFKGSATTTAKTIGKLGQALRFNGTASHVNVGSNSSLDDLDTITISAWIKPGTDMNAAGEIFAKTVDGGIYTDGPDVWYDPTDSHKLMFAQGFTGGSGFAIWYASNAITRGQWQHIAIVYSRASAANNPAMYVNGVAQTVTADVSFPAAGTARSDSAGDAVIGAYGGVNTLGFFKGVIDDVRIYNRLLSASEVKQLYNLGR